MACFKAALTKSINANPLSPLTTDLCSATKYEREFLFILKNVRTYRHKDHVRVSVNYLRQMQAKFYSLLRIKVEFIFLVNYAIEAD